ncbi:AbrB/MazE/SpoVT family DNA-binding domain-containing protein [bacterium]|nr:AbrB/MazE/SpoVT family DNA-binding domain-containing protein [bacterium]
MNTRIQKWGNSLALRIPKPFAEEVGLMPESAVEINLKDGTLVVTPTPKKRITLDELLASVTEDNTHEEYDWGEAVGKEVW